MFAAPTSRPLPISSATSPTTCAGLSFSLPSVIASSSAQIDALAAQLHVFPGLQQRPPSERVQRLLRDEPQPAGLGLSELLDVTEALACPLDNPPRVRLE